MSKHLIFINFYLLIYLFIMILAFSCYWDFNSFFLQGRSSALGHALLVCVKELMV